VVKVSLTEKGRKTRDDFMERRKKELECVFEKLNPDDHKELLYSMEKACDILRKIQVTD
jgi:DNA-binding MarR family transcriptional regulator